MSAAGEVVCEGWLRKSPPEKKLRRYAWKRRWFVLRSGRLSGEPDVLQYFKNQQSRRPIRTINMNLCEQVDAGLTFTKKELESSFVFDLKTEERTWYLVAESEEDMNRWVSSICLLCGFNPTDDAKLPVSGSSSNTAMTPTSGTVSITMVTGSVPPPYDPVSVRNLEHDGNLQDANYVPMTPLTPSLPVHPTPATGDLASLGRQVPPPAHLGFRNSPLTPAAPGTPPLRRNTVNPEVKAMPPPIHRNLKPQRRGDPSSHRTARPPSAHSSSPSSDSDDTDDNYVAMTTTPNLSFSTGEMSLRLMLHRASESGVSSPLLRRARGEKQVEYLDLDLHTGRSTPTRQERARGGRTRVDYVVVDPKRTKALRSTREAWHDGRMSTEKEKC
uniref:PH domain-containing protein n=1 Tax=Sander lucioperca TaxID=283035 RepID=A0A8D0CPZ5_SANLU